MKSLMFAIVFAAVLMVTACNVDNATTEVVEKSYAVIVRSIDTVEYISRQVAGSELGADINDDLVILRDALVALRVSVVSFGLLVGADLNNLPTIYPQSVEDPVVALDSATEDLIRSVEKIE